MNKQNLNKLKLLFMGVQSRFEDNPSIFKGITVKYTTGLKEFNGAGEYDQGKIKYNFNGKTELYSIHKLLDLIIYETAHYNQIKFTYIERGSTIIINGDNKNVNLSNVNSKEDINSDAVVKTSSLLNREYYIKVGKANSLLKELGIMSSDGKIKNDKIRKYNQIDRYVELLESMLDKLPKSNTLNILDCGCGKSYLTFALNYYLTEIKKRKCFFIGLDRSKEVIAASNTMAKNLGYRNMEFQAIDIKEYSTTSKINVVISLHACDTATDMALALGIKVESDLIVAVPCCHKELSKQYSYEPFKNITKYGVLKTKLADVLTDGMRSLMLEAKGYDVSVVEYISPLETPKNIMIRALKTKESNDDAMDSYISLMSSLNVYPALYDYLNNK